MIGQFLSVSALVIQVLSIIGHLFRVFTYAITQGSFWWVGLIMVE